MAITRRITQVFHGATTAGQIVAPTIDIGLGVPASMATTFSASSRGASLFGGDTTSGVTAMCGYRVVNTMDLSTRSAVYFAAAQNNLGRSTLRLFSEGGIRIVFQDGSSNWAAFNIYGRDIGPFSATADGGLTAFAGFADNSTGGGAGWFLSRDLTPAASSGVLNWANITAFEVHFRPNTSTRCQLVVGRFATLDTPLHTGSVSGSGFFSDVAASYGSASGSDWPLSFVYRNPLTFMLGASSVPRSFQTGLQIGDGSAATTLALSSVSFILWKPPQDNTGTEDVPNPSVLLSSPRLVNINQSATDNVTFSDSSFSTSSLWGLTVQGNTAGTCSFSRCQFWRFATFTCGHGTFTDCLWDTATAPVQVSANSTITRGTVRNATAGGLQITGAAGNYATRVNAAFSNNTTYDIALGSGGAGTYVLSGISVVGSYTLKIRNDSATNAVTVEIPAGITYTTSTAGGSITVVTPAVYQSVTINGLVTGSRVYIYDTVTATVLANAVASGSSYTWTDPSPATANRNIWLRVAYQSGVTAKKFIDVAIGTAGTTDLTAAVTYLANQEDDPVYNLNAIDGSAVTGISIDDAIDRVVISIAGGAVTWPEIYAYQVYWLATSAGIIDDAAFITAPDTANYLLSGFQIRNTSTVPLTITGGYGRDAATETVAACIDTAGSTGNIYPAPDHVVPFSTGSGLTAGQAAKLESLDTQAVNVVSIKGQAINGSGTESDPWGP